MSASVIAVHDNVPVGSQLFELGNGVNPTVNGSADILGSGQPGPDWQDIFNSDGNVYNLAGGIVATFLKDNTSQKGATDKTIFASSNKNNDPITGATGWNWDGGNVPAKDDLVNTYAWADVSPVDGSLIVYVGIERLAPEGDSHVDIEFFQDDVALDEAIPCDDPGNDATPCNFVGNRTHHDVLVSMDFLNGGAIGEVSVRLYNSTTGEYDLVETLVGEGCNGVAAANLTADSICAFNNGAAINGGNWTNFDRHGNEITNIAAQGFTEFGLNLTAAAGGSAPCISTIMAKTRSSQSFTAELKDFAGPFPFDICGANIAIAPDGVNPVGAPHTFNVTVNATIAGVVSPAPDGTPVNVTLTDTLGAVSVITGETCSLGTVAGTCNVTFTSNTPGTVIGHAAADVTIGGVTIHVETNGTAGNSGNATKVFIGRPAIKLSEFGYNNTPSGAVFDTGVVNGTTNYTIRMKNFGNVTGNLSTFFNVSIPGGLASGTFQYLGSTGSPTTQPAALTSCVSPCAVTWIDVPVAPGAEVVFRVEVKYNDVPDATLIRASLNATYTVLGFTPRQPSGVPATIEFTVQRD